MHIVVLAGGIGGARFLTGVRAYARETGAEVTAIVNVGDDVTMHGLRICPDLDSVMYTLGGAADPERGWGRRRRDLGGQGRTGRLRRRADLVRPRRQRHRHPPGTQPDAQRRLPAVSGHRGAVPALATRRAHAAGHATTGSRRTSWSTSTARRRSTSRSGGCATAATCRPSASSSSAPSTAKPAAGVLEALATADVVLVAPSNPVVSIGPILAVPGLRDGARPHRVVGVSPIIGGSPVRGMADKCLAVLGVAVHGGRGRRDVRRTRRRRHPRRRGWSTPPTRAPRCPVCTVRAVPLWMTDEQATAEMVRAAVALV